MRNRSLCWIAVVASVLGSASSSFATLIVRESFYGVSPANRAMGEYIVGNVAGGGTYQNPVTLGSAGDAWEAGLGSGSGTGVFKVAGEGLSYPGAGATGGRVEFFVAHDLNETRSIKRTLTQSYNLDSPAYYISGLMSFDASFNTAATATAYVGLTNTEDLSNNRVNTTVATGIHGIQFGFQGNGSGVDAMMRVRVAGTEFLENVVLQSAVASGTHQFVFKVEPNYTAGSVADRVSVWLNPANLASEAVAGVPIHVGDYSNWYPGGDAAGSIVDTLTLRGHNVGGGAVVGVDELRFGTSWGALFDSPEQHRIFRRVGTYDNVGAQLSESSPDTNMSTNTTMAVGRTGSGTTRLRSVLGFELADIPQGAIITGASLTLTPDSVDRIDALVGDIELRRLVTSQPMVESEVTWNQMSDGVDWTAGGGDFTTLLGTVGGYSSQSPDLKSRVYSTEQLRLAVQDALDMGRPLEMILLSPGTELANERNFLRFYSERVSQLERRPLLTVTYTVIPEPSTAMLAVMALAMVAWRRRR